MIRDYLRSTAERCKEADRQRARYWSDPAYRLDRINRARARLGLAPHDTLEAINDNAVRDQRGRFA